jgi:hypothetical protein
MNAILEKMRSLTDGLLKKVSIPLFEEETKIGFKAQKMYTVLKNKVDNTLVLKKMRLLTSSMLTKVSKVTIFEDVMSIGNNANKKAHLSKINKVTKNFTLSPISSPPKKSIN